MDFVITSGPLFDGRASAAAMQFTEEARTAVAREGVNRVHARLNEVLKNQTGFYLEHIHTERQVDDLMITDTPVVYGPWLEGVGSRNQTTRFKGYHTFRAVSQQLDKDSAGLAEAKLPPYLAVMNI